MAVDCGNEGISAYGTRAASVSESAKAPRPEPRTSPIFGRSEVRERMSCAAESAAVNWSVINCGTIFRSVRVSAFSIPPVAALPINPCDEDVATTSKSFFKFLEFAFQLPLFFCALVRGEKLRAGRGWFLCAGSIGCAGGDGPERGFSFTPKAFARKKTVLNALPRHILQHAVGKIKSLNGTQIFVRHVRAVHAFVVRRERDWHAVFQIDRKRVVFAADAENEVVRRYIDLDQYIALREL